MWKLQIWHVILNEYHFHLPCTQVWFTLATSITATCECLLAVALTVWYSVTVMPILDHCDPEFIQGKSTTTCECSLGFIDPPSLKRVVYRFKNVSDCEALGEMLNFFNNVLLALFSVGAVLSVLVAVFAIKKLNSLGACGKSGVYVVTPDQSLPTPVSLDSQRPSPSFSHRSVTAPSSSNYAGFSTTSQRYVHASRCAHTHTHTHTHYTHTHTHIYGWISSHNGWEKGTICEVLVWYTHC